MEKLKRKLRFDQLMLVSPIGRSGGLALFWLNSVQLQMIQISKGTIDTRILPISHSEWWRLTCVYGSPDETQRAEQWQMQGLKGDRITV